MRYGGAALAAGILCVVASAGGAGWAAEPEEGPEEAVPRRLTVDDYFRIRELDEPRVSPDGRWIAYEVTTHDLEEDESRTRIWMVPAAGGEAVPMTSEKASSTAPRWSPDGRYLSFLSARGDEKAQVWTLYREGGEAVQATDVVQGVSAHEWSPDGRRMVLVIRDPKPGELEEKDAEETEKKKKTEPPWVIDRQQFKQDYQGYLDRRRTHLYLFEVPTGELEQLTFGDYDDSDPAWSPDGGWVAFVSNRTENPDANYDSDVWRVPTDAAEPPEPQRVTVNPGEDRAPAWSPDGRSIATISATDTEAIVYATYHLAVFPAAGGEPVLVTEELDRQVLELAYSPDGRWIYFVMEDGAEQPLARIPAAGGPIERVIEGENVVDVAFDFHPQGGVAALVSTPDRPFEVFSLGDRGLERLTHLHDELMAELRLGAMETVVFPSSDGTSIEGLVVKPPDFEPGRRYPAVLRIHGGPVAQYDPRFHFQAQLLAAQGYVVLLPNPRGSSGYGQNFTLAIWQDWGGIDYEDVMAAVDHAVAKGWADPERLGVGGWSYGGMLTNHVITRTDRFKAAITGASATLYVVNYGHDQYQRWWEYELGLPWENREAWERLSPFNRVDRVVTPTLILGGEKDWNVPIINSEQLFLALKRLGRTVELVVYPGEYHGIDTPSHTRDLYQRYVDWYARFLGAEGAAAAGVAP